MNAKFYTSKEKEVMSTIEFGLTQDGYFKLRTIEHFGSDETITDVFLNKDDLFELIGYLLRVQSVLKKGGKDVI